MLRGECSELPDAPRCTGSSFKRSSWLRVKSEEPPSFCNFAWATGRNIRVSKRVSPRMVILVAFLVNNFKQTHTHTTPHHTTPHHTTPHHTTPHHTTPHHTTPHHTTPHHTTQHNTTQHNTTQHNTTQHNTHTHTNTHTPTDPPTLTQKHRNTETQKHRNTQIPKHTGAQTQTHKHTNTHTHNSYFKAIFLYFTHHFGIASRFGSGMYCCSFHNPEKGMFKKRP